MTLQEYLTQKGISIEAARQIAVQKGIELPQDLEAILDERLLKSLNSSSSLQTRQKSFAMRYGHIFSSQRRNIKTDPKTDSEKPLEYTTTSLQKSHPSEKNKSSKEIIGIVKFFDPVKSFGIILTTANSIKKNAEDNGKLLSFYLSGSHWESPTFPKENEWVVFTPKKGNRGEYATKVRQLTFDSEGLKVALEYRGKYAKIKGKDIKGDYYDLHVLSHLINNILFVQSEGIRLILHTLAEYISKRKEGGQEEIIEQLLGDSYFTNSIASFLSEMMQYEHDDAALQSIIHTLASKTKNAIFEPKSISRLDTLPKCFDFNSFQEEIIEILETAVRDQNPILSSWLECHKDFAFALTQQNNSLSIALLYAIFETNHNYATFNCSQQSWKDIYGLLCQHDEKHNAPFLYNYFGEKSIESIREAQLTQKIKKSTLDSLINLCFENSETRKNILLTFAEEYVTNNLPYIEKCIQKEMDISHLYPKLADYLNQLSYTGGAVQVESFFEICLAHQIDLEEIVLAGQSLSDEMHILLFLHTTNLEYLKSITNLEIIATWLNRQEEKWLCHFLQTCQKSLTQENDKAAIAQKIITIQPKKLKEAIEYLEEDKQYELLQLFPENYTTDFIVTYLPESSIFKRVVEEKWKSLQTSIPYVAFDLESDGVCIHEFAFRNNGNTTAYKGEAQLHTLLHALKNTQIIVGHRIKEWDLGHVLSKKGYASDAFVWDTLEIEILLNPCQYSYALQTTHTAQEDTDFVDHLFWNQLYRLSCDEVLCEELSEFIPTQIQKILEALRQPIFATFLQQSAEIRGPFYQTLVDTDANVVEALQQIDSTKEKTLIIAPRRLWSRISQHISLSFLQAEEVDSIEYATLSYETFDAHPQNTPFLKALVRRFNQVSKSPIVANIAQYIRLNYLPDTLLSPCVYAAKGEVACADMDFLTTNEDEFSRYEHVYFIGCEIENRLNQYRLPTAFSPADFWSINSNIPMRLGASSFLSISQDDRKGNIFADVPKNAANVWIERTHNGKYIINYNFDFYQKLQSIKADGDKGFQISTIPWTIKTDAASSIVLVYSEPRQGFDALSKRVSATSRYRATYWNYQFALIQQIRHQDRRPIILIIDDELEIERIETYARSLGLYLPTEGTLIRKMELIEHTTNGMLVVSKERFFELVDWRKDTPYCYIWDQMAVEKHSMMWHGFTDENNKSFLYDEIEEKTYAQGIGSTQDTYQTILQSIWPVFEYYYLFIRANHPDSTLYILDSYLEEYHTLSSLWGVTSYAVQSPWHNEAHYQDALKETRTFFPSEADDSLSKTDIQTAMDLIFSVMVNSDDDPNKKWHDYQAAILPQILSKQENYLVSLPTGGGKSVLFQGPALYRAAYTNKLSIVITPLKALMQDQVKELSEKGFITNVDFLNGDRSYQEVRSIYRKINGGEIALIYVTPERFRSRAFINALSTRMANDQGLEYMIFDEAHCISQWGMEFRPEYLNVIKKSEELSQIYGRNMCVAMFSATVTDMIFNHINEVIPVKRLGQENDKKIYNPVRNHIGMKFQLVEHDALQRIDEIALYIQQHQIDPKKSRMLVFCKTRKQCEENAVLLADALKSIGVLEEETASLAIDFFHAGMESDDREDTYTRFKDTDDPLYILCATKAFGMGMDIPNIHYIVHFAPPTVMEDYLQEVGRAGRNKAQYEAVGFSEENPIPAVCLFSIEDFKKSKEQLLLSSLSWADLEKIRQEMGSYIAKIQSIEKTQESPIVIPNNLWTKDQYDSSYTDFKIGQYWLERMGRIKMGYLSPTHINIMLPDEEATTLDNNPHNILDRSKNKKQYTTLLAELKELQLKQDNHILQVSLQALSAKMGIHSTQLLDQLIRCEKAGLLSIEEKTRCRIAFTRISEVNYMLCPNPHEVALQIILKTTCDLLGQQKLNREKSYTLADITNLIQANDTLQEIVRTKVKSDNKGGLKEEQYMIWHNEDKRKNKGLSLAKSYHKDLYQKRSRQIFALLEMIPGVKLRSYIDSEKKHVLQSVIVENEAWKKFMPHFENDCLRLIKQVSLQSEEITRWSEIMINLQLEEQGFAYFNSLIRFLSGMAYIVTDNLLPTGIEIYTTPTFQNPISETPIDDHTEINHKRDFDEAIKVRTLRLKVMEALSTHVKTPADFQKLITAYFSSTNATELMELLGEYYDDNDPIWQELRAEAILKEEKKLQNNPQQWAIYSANSNENINVEAGPGSGKTHLLTLKCAKLIYRQHVKPQSILVLAYNRAVVVELKSRLAKLFASLGLSRSASQLHVYTFHSLAKRICGEKALKNHDMNQWEGILLETIHQNPKLIRQEMPDLQYVFIDEFQDITQTRLYAMFSLKEIFPQLAFFTIGDKDQSIYGFEKKESMDPNYYYGQLYNELKPKKMTMNTNYRSYPEILRAASHFLPPTSTAPVACQKKQENAPQTDYVYLYSNRDWAADFGGYVLWLKEQGISDLAVFFRTNNEVYHGYSLIKSLHLEGIRIRIQGASATELFRVREIYFVLHKIKERGQMPLQLKNGETEKFLLGEIKSLSQQYPNWDNFYLDLVFVLILDYLDWAASEEDSYTYTDMAEAIQEMLKEDNPQLYKIYDDKRFADRRIFATPQLNVILTTMHKVKGLEFDAVIITPSFSSLPFNPLQDTDPDQPLSIHDHEQVEEEKRLLYVAYTRAKKFLFSYKGEREMAIDNKKRFASKESEWGIREHSVSLDRYNLGYNTGLYGFAKIHAMGMTIERNHPVTIVRSDRGPYSFFDIRYDGITIGQLSTNSDIRRDMINRRLYSLSGFFVSDVYCWRYEDSIEVDKRSQERGLSSDYTSKWCDQAKEQGFVFVVNIAGYGK